MFLKICQSSQENTCAKDSGTGAFLWMLQNIYEHLFHRTTPGLTVSDKPCKREQIFNKLEKQSILMFLVFKYIKRMKTSHKTQLLNKIMERLGKYTFQHSLFNQQCPVFVIKLHSPLKEKISHLAFLLRNYFPVVACYMAVVILQCTLTSCLEAITQLPGKIETIL